MKLVPVRSLRCRATRIFKMRRNPRGVNLEITISIHRLCEAASKRRHFLFFRSVHLCGHPGLQEPAGDRGVAPHRLARPLQRSPLRRRREQRPPRHQGQHRRRVRSVLGSVNFCCNGFYATIAVKAEGR